MLVYDPVDRITCEEALQHPYFDSIDKTQFASPDFWYEIVYVYANACNFYYYKNVDLIARQSKIYNKFSQ